MSRLIRASAQGDDVVIAIGEAEVTELAAVPNEVSRMAHAFADHDWYRLGLAMAALAACDRAAPRDRTELMKVIDSCYITPTSAVAESLDRGIADGVFQLTRSDSFAAAISALIESINQSADRRPRNGRDDSPAAR